MTTSGTVSDATGGTLVERAADYWSTARFEDVTPEAIRLAKRFLLDTLAAGIAGSGSDVVDIAIKAARAGTEATSGSAVLWGRDGTLPAAQAALVNGTASHAYELDDFGGCGHSGAVVVPVVMALAGRGGVSGRDALMALLAGYDLAARVLEGAGGYRAAQRPRLALDRNVRQLRCGSCRGAHPEARSRPVRRRARHRRHLHRRHLGVPGRWSHDQALPSRQGGRERPFGGAARAGRHDAARARCSRPSGAASSPPTRPGIATPEVTLDGLGKEFRIDRSGMKPYACCRGLHACLDALFQIMQETGADASAIRRMIVHGNAQFRLQFDRPEPANLLDAQFSMQYALAVAATSGRATLDQFQPQRTAEPEVRRLMAATTLLADRTIKPGEYPAPRGRAGRRAPHRASRAVRQGRTGRTR